MSPCLISQLDSAGITVTVHNTVVSGSERKFEKGLVKLRGTWSTIYELRLTETLYLS